MFKGRTTLLLLISVFALGLFIWVQEVWRAKTPSKEARRVRLFNLNEETLVSVRFLTESNQVECVKENGVWMTGNAERGYGRADLELIHRMVSGLNSMGKGTTITSEHLQVRGLDAAEYGFDNPAAEIIAVDNKGWHHWLIGRKAPLGGMVYVKEGDGDEIYTVMDRLLEMVPPEPDTLRDRTLFPGNPAGVRRVELRGSGGFIQIIRDADGAWQMQQPLTAAADAQGMEDLLEKLYRLRIESFVAENVSDFSPYGLQGETRQISLGGTDGTSRMLVIGDAITDQPGFVYARRADDTTVFSIDETALELLDIRHDSLRDARILPLPAREISYISMKRGGEQLELASDEFGSWAIISPVLWDADAQAVVTLLKLWDGAVITEFNEPDSAASLEWDIRFGSAELQQTNQLEVLPVGNDHTGLRIRRTEAPGICRINLPYLPDGLLDPLQFKDRELWRLSRGDIQKITVEKVSAERQVVERDQTGNFVPGITNSTAKVEDEALGVLLDELTLVRVDEYIAYNPHDLSIYGLTEPAVTLHMGLSGTNQLGRVLLIGQEAAEGFYAMVKGQDVVFLLNKELVGLISSDLLGTRPAASVTPVNESP